MKKATQKQKDKIREFIKGHNSSFIDLRICGCLDDLNCIEPEDRCSFCRSKELQDKFLNKLNIVEASQIITTIYVSDLDKLIKSEFEWANMHRESTERLIDEGHMGGDYYAEQSDFDPLNQRDWDIGEVEKYRNIKTNILKINQNILERYGR
tara:strand:+ start:29 stop:484 length:456 start_codon:yes stop_codon:yes gene_type:complete